ncbi:response regulator transcription factor [bacterium]|nr:response regulator transcription factor [bacterium]
MKPKDLILIVEDDDAISKLLELSLTQQGYRTLVAHNLQSALRELQTHSPELILLDLGLPDGDGKGMIKIVRASLSTPIIVVSARQEEKEIIASLDLGADDYVTKPFSVRELMARVRSIQRRFLGLQPTSDLIACNEITIDLDQHSAFKNDVLLKLTPTEFNLLRYFMLHRNMVLTHNNILKEVWGVGYQNEMQYLRTYINTLRKKIEADTTRPFYIQTELSIGYRFCCTCD